jgi:hypothetical protein
MVGNLALKVATRCRAEPGDLCRNRWPRLAAHATASRGLSPRERPPEVTSPGQPVLQETEGQVHVPLVETVKPQLLPLPLGVAFITYWLGQVALTFQVE